MAAKPVHLLVGGEERVWSTQKALLDELKGLREKGARRLHGCEEDLVMALWDRSPHADPSLPPIVGAAVSRSPGERRVGRCCVAVLSDGTQVPFSAEDCVKNPSPKSEWTDAFREAIYESQIVRFRERWESDPDGWVCPVSGWALTPSTGEVDHADPTFSRLLAAFVDLRGIDTNRPGGPSETLVAWWSRVHEWIAVLRMVAVEVNQGRRRPDSPWFDDLPLTPAAWRDLLNRVSEEICMSWEELWWEAWCRAGVA